MDEGGRKETTEGRETSKLKMFVPSFYFSKVAGRKHLKEREEKELKVMKFTKEKRKGKNYKIQYIHTVKK